MSLYPDGIGAKPHGGPRAKHTQSQRRCVVVIVPVYPLLIASQVPDAAHFAVGRLVCRSNSQMQVRSWPPSLIAEQARWVVS